MNTPLKLPTTEEIDRAWRGVCDEPPVPLAWLVDRHKHLRGFVETLADQVFVETPLDRGTLQPEQDEFKRLLYMLLKAAFVGGLHLGIRIGEERKK